MKLMIDTARDNPRLIRAAIAMVLAALDDGSALPAGMPAGTMLLPQETAAPLAPPPPPPPPVAAPSTAVAAAPPNAPDPAAAAAFGTQLPAASAPNAAPPAPPAAAPLAPVPPANPAGAVALDRDGFPWDARIHSASRAFVADGTWKLKKGMSLQKNVVDAVRAELRQTMALPVPAAAAAAPVTLAPPPPPPAPPAAAAPAAAAPPPPPPAAAPAGADPATFPDFMTWIAGLIQSGKWTHQQTTTALSALGLPSAVGLSSRPDLIPSAVATIRAMLPA